ncbi:E3 ubiquitin-protein ligase-like [Neoarius graeffei]|uniref:E3 ubiquitin-protein ligase-like n=1 Tax=Neoarius graeffei TaxID=443677 RepID=UPI00298C8897|nr:E3 ubiquitin-protein ligase-like [Neoarius graeffei]
MLSELECGICFRLYDTAARCPRQLACKHSFCESCLLTLSVCQSGSRMIICAFCRHSTPLTGEKLRDSLPVDEDTVHRLEEEGVHGDQEEDEEPRTETISQSKEGHSPRGRVWRSIKRLYKKIKQPSQRGCITHDEMRDLAIMAYFMM